MTILDDSLTTYARALACGPFVWGSNDCLLSVADWWRTWHGVDPAAAWRGTYSTEAGSHAILAREGGLLRLMARMAKRLGALLTDDPRPGDVGVIRNAGAHLAVVHGGNDLWLGKGPMGVVAVRETGPVAVWKLEIR